MTTQGGPQFVQPGERIATFDNDGTLCCEQPLQAQFHFAFDRVKGLAAKDPAMGERPAFKAVLERDYNTLFGLGMQALLELAFATHAGMTDEEFDEVARGWLATAKHPKFARLFKHCVYRPQVELLSYLRDNGFKTYIVSAGGADFMRAFADEAYGVPREQVIGSSVKLRFDFGGRAGFAYQAARAQHLQRPGGEAAEHRSAYRSQAAARVRQFGRRSRHDALREVQLRAPACAVASS